MNKKDLTRRACNALREMYARSKPPLILQEDPNDWNPDPNWFRLHYLSDENYESISKKALGRLNKPDKSAISLFLSSFGPSSNEENVKIWRENHERNQQDRPIDV